MTISDNCHSVFSPTVTVLTERELSPSVSTLKHAYVWPGINLNWYTRDVASLVNLLNLLQYKILQILIDTVKLKCCLTETCLFN